MLSVFQSQSLNTNPTLSLLCLTLAMLLTVRTLGMAQQVLHTYPSGGRLLSSLFPSTLSSSNVRLPSIFCLSKTYPSTQTL